MTSDFRWISEICRKMLRRVSSAKCIGIQAVPVNVEVNISSGIGIHLVGLADAAVKELNRQIAELEGSHCTNAAWMNYFQQFGRLEQLTRWAAAIIINKILVYEDNRIKITFNFEADLNRIQEILSAAEEHKKEAI